MNTTQPATAQRVHVRCRSGKVKCPGLQDSLVHHLTPCKMQMHYYPHHPRSLKSHTYTTMHHDSVNQLMLSFKALAVQAHHISTTTSQLSSLLQGFQVLQHLLRAREFVALASRLLNVNRLHHTIVHKQAVAASTAAQTRHVLQQACEETH